MVAPSYVAAVKLSPFTDPYASEYPFSVKPDVPLSPQDLMRVQRDHYEGTQFDLTKGSPPSPSSTPPHSHLNPTPPLIPTLPPTLTLTLPLTIMRASESSPMNLSLTIPRISTNRSVFLLSPSQGLRLAPTATPIDGTPPLSTISHAPMSSRVTPPPLPHQLSYPRTILFPHCFFIPCHVIPSSTNHRV